MSATPALQPAMLVDAPFTYSRPLSGGDYFCPPTQDGRFDLRALRLA